MIKASSNIRMQTADGDLTLYGIFITYQEEIADNWRWNEQTQMQYRAMLLNTIIPCIDDHNTRPIYLYTLEYMDSIVRRIETQGYQKQVTGYASDTLKKFRHIMAVTMRTAITHMLCPDVWQSNKSGRVQSANRLTGRAKPVRYFTPAVDLSIIRYVMEHAHKVGEMRGLYIMMCTRCRENEAAGLTWEMIRDNDDNPQLLTVSIMQTTKLDSAKTKVGGKTGNAPRQNTLTPDQSAYVRELRSNLEERWLKNGGTISGFRRSRVATRKNKLWEPCRARHLSEATNEMFAELGLSDELATINRRLAKEAIEYAENPDFFGTPPETSATCYALRRAAATFDRVLGIDLQDRQYLMGHAVTNTPYTHVFVDAHYQCLLAKKSADRPGLNTIHAPISMLDNMLELRGAYHDTILASYNNGRIVGHIHTEEPGDQIHFVIKSTVPCEVIVKASFLNPSGEYSWKVNVKRKLHEMYAEEDKED